MKQPSLICFISRTRNGSILSLVVPVSQSRGMPLALVPILPSGAWRGRAVLLQLLSCSLLMEWRGRPRYCRAVIQWWQNPMVGQGGPHRSRRGRESWLSTCHRPARMTLSSGESGAWGEQESKLPAPLDGRGGMELSFFPCGFPWSRETVV